MRHVFPSNPPQNVQSSGIQGQNLTDGKTPGSASSSFVLSKIFIIIIVLVLETRFYMKIHLFDLKLIIFQPRF